MLGYYFSDQMVVAAAVSQLKRELATRSISTELVQPAQPMKIIGFDFVMSMMDAHHVNIEQIAERYLAHGAHCLANVVEEDAVGSWANVGFWPQDCRGECTAFEEVMDLPSSKPHRGVSLRLIRRHPEDRSVLQYRIDLMLVD